MSAVDDYWSRFFGLDPQQMSKPGIHVVRHVFLAGYNGAWFFRHDNTGIVSVPEVKVDAVRAWIETSDQTRGAVAG
jgi:hypothetical protein